VLMRLLFQAEGVGK